MTPGSDDPETKPTDDESPGVAQIRELLAPTPPPKAVNYRFPSVEHCLKHGITPQHLTEDLAEYDVLALRPRVVRRMRERYMIFDPERAWLRAIARAALYGVSEGRKTIDAAWLEKVVERSLQDLIEDDRDDEFNKLPLDRYVEHDFGILIEALGVPVQRSRLATVRFNDLPDERRRLAFRTIIEGWSLERCAKAGMGAREELEGELHFILSYVSNRDDTPHPGPATGMETD